MNDVQVRNGQSQLLAMSRDPSAVAMAQKEKSRIEAAYQMAVYQPRNEDESRARILAACQRPGFAERVEFSKPIGKKPITGPSIRYAELALREWGNIMTDQTIIYEDDDLRRVKVVITDAQTNTTFSKEIVVRKTVERRDASGRDVVSERLNSYGDTVYVVRCTDDELLTKEAALLSKALRTEGLRLIPQDITDEAIETARQTLHNRAAKDPEGERRRLLDAFVAIGITPKMLDEYLGHSTRQLTPAEVADLRAVYRSIRDGESRWSDFLELKQAEAEPSIVDESAGDLDYGPEAPPPTPERQVTATLEELKEAIRDAKMSPTMVIGYLTTVEPILEGDPKLSDLTPEQRAVVISMLPTIKKAQEGTD